MIKTIAFAALALSGAATLATPVQAQDITAWYNNQVAQNNAYYGQLRAGMMQQNLDDPQVMAAYRAGVCGPGLTPQQFAEKWMVTGGCTAQGMGIYMNNRNMNEARDQVAYQDYQRAQMARAEAMRMQQQGYYNNQYRAGMQLDGWRYTYGPDGRVIWYR